MLKFFKLKFYFLFKVLTTAELILVGIIFAIDLDFSEKKYF